MINQIKLFFLPLIIILTTNGFAASFPDNLEQLIASENFKLSKAASLIIDADDNGSLNNLGQKGKPAIILLLNRLNKNNNEIQQGYIQGLINSIIDLPSFDPNILCFSNSRSVLVEVICSKNDEFKYPRMEKLLQHKKIDPNLESNFGTPLFEAVLRDDLLAIKLLLKYKVDIDKVTTFETTTPVHLATQKDRIDIVSLLRKHGASLSKTNTDGKSALNCNPNWKDELGMQQILLSKMPESMCRITLDYIHLNLNPQLSVGDGHACATNSAGRLSCWGNNFYGQATVPDYLKNDDIGRVSAGSGYTCVINSNYRLFCWGKELNKKLEVPSQYTRIEQVSAGFDYHCAITALGKLFCWGDEEQFEHNRPNQETLKVLTKKGVNYVVDAENRLTFWDSKKHTDVSLPGLDNKKIKKVSASENNICVINTDDKLFCFTTWNNQKAPVPSDLIFDPVQQVSVGSEHMCAITTKGKLYCWGDNSEDQIDIPDELKNDVVQQVSAGAFSTCAINSQDKVVCFGNKSSNSLGTLSEISVPDELKASGH